MEHDISSHLQTQIKTGLDEKTSFFIQGSNSKYFYGNPVNAQSLEVNRHRGILNYHPSELVLTARAGTPLAEIEAELKKNKQCLPFEPPHFGPNATFGGTIASGLAGSARPFSGSVRDAVLGCRIINGQGEILRFGGEVVKNVAGYDVSRLMTGSLGTLGLILDISVKVLPTAPCNLTYIQTLPASDVITTMNTLRRSTLPLSGLAYVENKLHIRLAGTQISLAPTKNTMNGEILANDADFWHSLNEQTHPFFDAKQTLWKFSVPPATHHMALIKESIIDWGGGLYWFFSDAPRDEIDALANTLNGHAVLFRRGEIGKTESHSFPLPPSNMQSLHENIKQAFDPQRLFNPGRMYSNI